MFPFLPTLIGTGTSGEKFYTTSDESIQLCSYPHPKKQFMEADHLKHLNDLLAIQHPHLSFVCNGPGLDPPDFLISRNGVQTGIELTVWPAQERIERSEFFTKFKEKILSIYRSGKLRGLQGIAIRLDFNELGGKPFRPSELALSNLIAQIESLASQDLSDENCWPSGEVDESVIKWSVGAKSSVPMRGSDFANETGFEVSAGQMNQLSESSFTEILDGIIRNKDNPANDELLITVGAPNQNGRALTGDPPAIYDIVKTWKGLRYNPLYLKVIFLDIWHINKVFILLNKNI